MVGGGASGSAAALQASENGAQVVVVETTASPAGQGTMAGGMFATSSSEQIAKGEMVDPKWYYDQFINIGNFQVNGGLLSKVIQNSGKTVDWLIENGVKLTLAHPATGGYYEHKETHPASTLHGYTEGGVKGITALHNSIQNNGGKVLYETTAKDLILENGKVAGIIAEKADGGTLTIHADVVILATGGFGGNEEMVAETFGEGFGQSRVATNIGTGIELAKKAGGDAEYDKAIMMHYGISRGGTNWGTTLNSALLNPYLHVDVDGNRFMNEEFTLEPIKSSNVIKSLPRHTAYELFDSTMIETVKEKGFAGITDVFSGNLATDPTIFIEVGHEIDTSKRYEKSIKPVDLTEEINALVEEGQIIKAESPEEMAEKLGMSNLVDTINRYNELCAKGEDTDHFKSAKYLDNLEGTIYAVKITPSVFLGTLGGIEVNQNLQVIDKDGKPIGGLYAAGSEVSGVYSDSYVYLEGGTLGFAYGSGRIAGENAAAEVANN
ncbi:FAD-dependent oxidoreductase [Paenibacillus bouchesdurhonensis]|uniref:FAD-dependent oxidoreductase n=1 Tax=Paenibacillus bouchesdurhonensis TaxID=1870990 RepID=UPI002D21A3AF|nr:FAD-dependent oxidoreductase [Paenibacillus bouchesdurhonensis]